MRSFAPSAAKLPRLLRHRQTALRPVRAAAQAQLIPPPLRPLRKNAEQRNYRVIILRIMEKFTVICPCCEANLTIDAQTGAILSHEEKKKVLGSFDDLRSDLVKQKEARDNIFAQELGSQKDRERILEEKFKEAMKRA